MAGARLATLAGVAWIVSAVLTALFALLQVVFADEAAAHGMDLRMLAGWNGLAAIASLAAGVSLVLRSPRGLLGPRRLLALSAVWGCVTVTWNTYQMLNGAIHWAYLGATVAAFFALVLSVDARQRWTDTDSKSEGGRPG